MRKFPTLLALLALLLPAALTAQSGATIWVSPGSRIRVAAPTVTSDPVYGRLLVLDGDSLVMVSPPDLTPRRFDLANVALVQVSAGRARRQWGGVGAIVGGFVGLVAGGKAGGSGDTTGGLGALAGAMAGLIVGVPVGALVGVSVAPERWRTAWTPQH